MEDYERPAVLGIGLDATQATPADLPVELTRADGAREAVELLRMLRFDLLLVGLHDRAAPPWSFLRQVRACWPGQKWMLVGPHDLPADDEITARTLGVLQIVYGPVDWIAVRETAALAYERRAAANRLVRAMAARDAPPRVDAVSR